MESNAAGPVPQVRIYLLGETRVQRGEETIRVSAWERRSGLALLKLLALAPKYSMHREAVIESLWPNAKPDSSTNSLRKVLHLVRRVLEPDLPRGAASSYLRLAGETIQLVAQHVWVDVREFEVSATRALATSVLSDLQMAVAAYGGELLVEDRYDDSVARRRHELAERHLALLAALADATARKRGPAAGMEVWRELLRYESVHEEAHRRLIDLYLKTGQRYRALRQYDACIAALTAINAPPEPETEELHDRILRHVAVVGPRLEIRDGEARPALPQIERPSRLRDGGNQARSVHANELALSYYRDLVRSVNPADARLLGDARECLGATLAVVGKRKEALAEYERAGANFASVGDVHARGRVISRIGRLSYRRGETDSIGLLEETIRSLEKDSPRHGYSSLPALYASLAHVLVLDRRFDEADVMSSRAISIGQQVGDAVAVGIARLAQGCLLLQRAEASRAAELLSDFLPSLEAIDDLDTTARALTVMAAAASVDEKGLRGWTYLARALELAERQGDPTLIAFVLYRLGVYAWSTAYYREARQHLEQAAAIDALREPAFPAIHSLFGLAVLSSLAGDSEDAERCLHRSAEIAGDNFAQRWTAPFSIAAEHELLGDRLRGTAEHVDRCLTLFRD
ncbi:MAG: BTAD domain-containing putative transcriptional regulator [Chloroflexota bacterium]